MEDANLINEFQSTRPMRGATTIGPARRREREISIHAPHAGRDADVIVICWKLTVFQSTRPMRGATEASCLIASLITISIHAPHAGRDAGRFGIGVALFEDFNPRAPCGARLYGVSGSYL